MKTIYLFFLLFTLALLDACNKTQLNEQNNIPLGIPSDSIQEIGLIFDTIEQVPVLVVGSPGKNFIISFINNLGDDAKNLVPVQDALPIIIGDASGNRWDLSGKAVAGPLQGTKLKPTRSFIGYWFSWGTFFPGAEIYKTIPEQDQAGRPYLSGPWLIPENEVLSGGPGKDGIPALKNPKMTDIPRADYLSPEDLVLGLVANGEARAYPHRILDWHEIINDDIQGQKVAITYCPLTGTGIGWPEDSIASDATYGVSGKLYNSNLIPYDRETDSYWSQIRLDCVHGERKGEKLETIQLIETTWKTWSDMYPKTKVVSSNTGYNRNYEVYPYGDYKSSSGVYFPVSIMDSRLHPKERVHGIVINDHAKVYQFKHFDSN